jgi:hypothetical protein
MRHVLENPRDGLVKSAFITVHEETGRAWLSVETVYNANEQSGHLSLRGAKSHFTKEFLGGKNKWKKG